MYDAGSRSFFYSNKETGETTWDKPKDYVMVADETTLVRSCARAGVRIIIGRNMFDAGSLQVFVIRLQCWLRTCAAKREVKKRYRRALLARDKVGPCCPSYHVHPVVLCLEFCRIGPRNSGDAAGLGRQVARRRRKDARQEGTPRSRRSAHGFRRVRVTRTHMAAAAGPRSVCLG